MQINVEKAKLADRVYILCPFADKSSLYTSWLDRLPMPYTIERQPAELWHPPEDAAIAVTHMHYRHEDLAVLRRLAKEHPTLPVLILADGILEYRNVWQHPESATGSMFQPLLGHKLACIGKAQSRVIESWGNVGKCEVVGLPRLDSVVAGGHAKKSTTDKFRLLIVTAQTPAFEDSQYEIVVTALKDLQKWLNENTTIDGRTIETTWRLTLGLDQEIGLPPHDIENDGELPPMLDVLNEVDAVITTPSTVYLESIVKGLPTAILDYHNTPAYVVPAWTISAKAHLRNVIGELANPPVPKMMFQEATLHDNLECRTPAVDRLIELISAMIDCGNKAREAGEDEVKYPFRIVTDQIKGFFPVLSTFELEHLFPSIEDFKNRDLQALQVELCVAKESVEPLLKDLADCKVEREELRELLNNSRIGREEIYANFKDLQSRFGKLKERFAEFQKRKKPPSGKA